MWEAITAVGTLWAVLAAVGGYFLTWIISKKDRAQQQKLFQEEFRPVLTIKKKSAGNGKIVFTIKNIGNRAAKEIYVSFKATATKSIDGKLLYVPGKRQGVLKEDRCLQPTDTVDFTWEDDCLIGITSIVDAVLEYKSLSDVQYIETVAVYIEFIFDRE